MGRPRSRLDMRREYEAAEQLEATEDEAGAVVETPEGEAEPKAKKTTKKKAKTTKSRSKSKSSKPSARMRVVWAVVNDAFKTVQTFAYTEKAAAEAKAAELIEKGKGTHFIQRTKEEIPDDAPGLGASIPRSEEPTLPKVADDLPVAKAPTESEGDEESEEDEIEEEVLEPEDDFTPMDDDEDD